MRNGRWGGGLAAEEPGRGSPGNLPTAQVGAQPKLDFTVKRDEAGTVLVRFLPEMLYFDARRSPAGQKGRFPPGSNYGGASSR